MYYSTNSKWYTKLLVVLLVLTLVMPMMTITANAGAETTGDDFMMYVHEADIEIPLADDTEGIEIVVPTEKTVAELQTSTNFCASA